METDTALTAQSTSDAPAPYAPMPWSLKEIRAAIPARCFHRNTFRSFLYLFRDLTMAAAFWTLATAIDPFFSRLQMNPAVPSFVSTNLHWFAWCLYWWLQGLVFTGIWVIGHECGHGAFSPHRKINDTIGFITHSFLWTPYFSWKISHHRHHISHASMERDEVYVPNTRSDLGIPPPGLILTTKISSAILRSSPFFNSSGQKQYPRWTNHFSRSYKFHSLHKGPTRAVIISNLGLLAMAFAIRKAVLMYGTTEVIKYYGIPWLAVTHWFIMITYLHHTDPIIPHFRGKEWNFQRGAAATVDRPFLGWQGNFFLHSVARYHAIHHFFPKMPFYHGKEATEALKAFIGDYYTFSDKPVFQALWENYNRCQFVDDEGDIIFYRDKKGESVVKGVH
ncbi:fatty acid desaturase-domain-containing protein [Mycena leptocephala]|nr:fatty acid desaturase-domain-containing protein [Mycena leptocephala]